MVIWVMTPCGNVVGY